MKGEEGVIESRGVNKSVDVMKSCEWLIEGKKSKIVRLHFESFSVQCSKHNLTILDGDNETPKKLCGDGNQSDIYSISQRMKLEINRVRKTKSEFNISYKLIDASKWRLYF